MKTFLTRALLVLGCWTCGIFFAIFLGGKTAAQPIPAGIAAAGTVAFLVAALKAFPAKERKWRAFELAISAFVFFVGSAIVFPVFAGAQAASTRSTCISNVKDLVVDLSIYSADHNDRFPPDNVWRTASEPAPPSGHRPGCPISEAPYSYAFNEALSKRKDTDLEDVAKTVMVFEFEGQIPNLAGGPTQLLRPHSGMTVIGYADGHAKPHGALNPEKPRWTP